MQEAAARKKKVVRAGVSLKRSWFSTDVPNAPFNPHQKENSIKKKTMQNAVRSLGSKRRSKISSRRER
jgi:hypothetical protein